MRDALLSFYLLEENGELLWVASSMLAGIAMQE